MSKKATIKITSDTKDAQSGLDKVTKKINEFSKSNNENLSSLKRFNGAITGAVKSFGAVGVAAGVAVKAIKKINETVQETTKLYKEQIKAERQLETAASNNPYLDNSSVTQLKAFAGELQKVSNVGDEELLPMMAQLASAGRTQEEIQKIMTAALDLSASGMMSLDSAVTALNKTFAGTSGQLGNQIAGLKDLTKEELAAGKAVDIVADKFKGMAEATIDTAEQLKNMKGDFKEAIGEFTLPSSDLWNKFWTGFYEKGTEVIKRFNDYLDSSIIGKGIASSLSKELQKLTDARERRLYSEDEIHLLTDDQLNALNKYLSGLKKLNAEEAILLQVTKDEAESRAYLAKLYQEMDAEAAESASTTEEESEAVDTLLEKRNKLRQQYEETLRKTSAEIENRRKLGETIDEETEAQIMLNAATQAYINMYSDPAFNRALTKTGTWEGEEAQLKQIENWASMIHQEEELTEEEEEDLWEHEKEIAEAWQTQEQETLEIQKELLENYLYYLEAKGNLSAEEEAQEEKLRDAIKKIDDEIAQNRKQSIADTVSEITRYIQNFAGLTNDITSLARENNEAELNNALGDISKQYTDGLISYEDYCEKKKQLEKKAATEEYKLKQWEWTSSILQATANVAEGVSKAIAQGGIAGIVTGALVAAAGAAQIAAITANKPKAPAFAGGGVVGGVNGATAGGDNTYIHARTGEMVLNAQQQKNLWDMANRNSGGGAVVNMPVTIENTASDKVSASAQMSQNGLSIIIRDIVRNQMERGDYTQSMQIANSKANGAAFI